MTDHSNTNNLSHRSLVKLPEVRETMNAMAKEMMRAGMIEEMVDETMSSMEVCHRTYHTYELYYRLTIKCLLTNPLISAYSNCICIDFY